MEMNPITILKDKFTVNEAWLSSYANFLSSAPDGSIRHHIIPKKLLPEYTNLDRNPWNSKLLHPGDHLYAHFLLCKALPGNMVARRAFLYMARLSSVPEELPQEMRDHYQTAKAASLN